MSRVVQFQEERRKWSRDVASGCALGVQSPISSPPSLSLSLSLSTSGMIGHTDALYFRPRCDALTSLPAGPDATSCALNTR